MTNWLKLCYKKMIRIIFMILVGILFIFYSFEMVDDVYIEAKTIAELEDEINRLVDKIDEKKAEATSLSRELSIIEDSINLKNAQISKLEAEIIEKETELKDLKEEIRLLEIRLERVSDNIDKQRTLIEVRLRRQYIEQKVPILEKILSTRDLGDTVAHFKYLQFAQRSSENSIQKLEITKDNYVNKQEELKTKKIKVEEIKREIENKKMETEALRSELSVQRNRKEDVLKATKNDEARYKALLEAAQKELEQIQQAANVVIRVGDSVDVEKGEVIGTMGNTGYSTGIHLHFGIYKYTEESFKNSSSWGWYYRNHVNPLKSLKSKTVQWATGCRYDPSGYSKVGNDGWASWPVDQVRITQNYGNNTCYNWYYGGKPHPALDIGRPYINGYRQNNVPIKAIDDGKAYFCRNCLNDGGNGVFIFHNNGYMSVYWHLK